ncbi:uncharacterized protein LOC144625061 [Crassostrea virginica]
MNHCQFLTHGLLKVFLKEVITQQLDETNKLLWSYHMKTIVFLVIQQNVVPIWRPKNLLASLWVCFKLILKWVYEGSPSIRSYITDALYNPRLSFCTDTDRILSECNMDEEHFFEGLNVPSATKNLDHRIKLLNTIGWMIGSSLTQYQVVMIFTADRMSCNMLKLGAKFGCISDLAYISKHIDTTLAQTPLEEQQVIVHYDIGLYVPHLCRNSSWAILGICQQMTGNTSSNAH